jgi:hypothetical protein
MVHKYTEKDYEMIADLSLMFTIIQNQIKVSKGKVKVELIKERERIIKKIQKLKAK